VLLLIKTSRFAVSFRVSANWALLLFVMIQTGTIYSYFKIDLKPAVFG